MTSGRQPNRSPYQLRRQSLFHVEHAVRFFDRPDGALDLGDESRFGCRITGENVNRASLAVLREAHFDLNYPTTGQQQTDCPLHQRCVSFIEKPISCRSMPPRCDFDVRAEGLKGSPDSIKLDCPGFAGFNEHQVISRDRGETGNSALRAAQPATKSAR